MGEVVEFSGAEGPPDVVGPESRDCAVIVDGRVIPRMRCTRHANGDVEFHLDRRFAFLFPKEWSYLAAAFAAEAMAIGAGYPHLGAESRDRPFAPRAVRLELSE